MNGWLIYSHACWLWRWLYWRTVSSVFLDARNSAKNILFSGELCAVSILVLLACIFYRILDVEFSSDWLCILSASVVSMTEEVPACRWCQCTSSSVLHRRSIRSHRWDACTCQSSDSTVRPGAKSPSCTYCVVRAALPWVVNHSERAVPSLDTTMAVYSQQIIEWFLQVGFIN